MKRCHIFLGRFHSSACPASVFLSLLQTGKAPGGGHPRLPRGPTPTPPVLGCPVLPVRLTAIDQGLPVRQSRNTPHYWLMLPTARVIPILYLKKLRLWAVYPRQWGLDLGHKATVARGQTPALIHFFILKAVNGGRSWEWGIRSCHTPLLPGRLPGVKVLEWSQDGLKS